MVCLSMDNDMDTHDRKRAWWNRHVGYHGRSIWDKPWTPKDVIPTTRNDGKLMGPNLVSKKQTTACAQIYEHRLMHRHGATPARYEAYVRGWGCHLAKHDDPLRLPPVQRQNANIVGGSTSEVCSPRMPPQCLTSHASTTVKHCFTSVHPENKTARIPCRLMFEMQKKKRKVNHSWSE